MTSRPVGNSHRLNAYMGKSLSFHYFMITTTPSISPECGFVNGGRVLRQSYLPLHVLTKSVVRRFRPSQVIVFITGKWNVWVFFLLTQINNKFYHLKSVTVLSFFHRTCTKHILLHIFGQSIHVEKTSLTAGCFSGSSVTFFICLFLFCTDIHK